MGGNIVSPTAPGRAVEDNLDAKQDLAGLDTCTPIVKLGVADITNANAPSFAGKRRYKKPVETVHFPEENGPNWAGAPGIVLRHFCGAAV